MIIVSLAPLGISYGRKMVWTEDEEEAGRRGKMCHAISDGLYWLRQVLMTFRAHLHVIFSTDAFLQQPAIETEPPHEHKARTPESPCTAGSGQHAQIQAPAGHAPYQHERGAMLIYPQKRSIGCLER